MVSFIGYVYPRVRLVEDQLPDAIPDEEPAQGAAIEPAPID